MACGTPHHTGSSLIQATVHGGVVSTPEDEKILFNKYGFLIMQLNAIFGLLSGSWYVILKQPSDKIQSTTCLFHR